MASVATPTAQNTQVSIRKIPLATVVGGVIAVVGNLIIFFIAQALGVVFEIPMGGPSAPISAIPVPVVAMFSFIPALGAGLLLAALVRFTKRPLQIFWVIAGIFLLVSFIPTFTLPVAMSIQLSLALMHIMAGIAIVWVLSTRTAN